ncbi:MAG: hypothetical protein WC343_02860 [Bacilli bacterium]|jgi:hypothetical protein
MTQPFEIKKEDLENIDFISPAGKDYNLHLNNGQEWMLSESGKTLYLINKEPFRMIKFIVSKTVFVLKKETD